MEVDDFISQFYNLTGIQYGERRRNFFFLLNQHSFLKDSKNELDQIVQNLKPRNHSERILRIDFLIFFRRYNELHQDYLRGDDMTIKKLSKQRWFHEKAFQVDDIIEFINNFLPSLPYTVRVKYLKKLQCDEEKCNKIFDAVMEKYGIFVATNMLHKCSCEKIAEILRQYPIKLSHRDIKRIFDKKCELVDIYFEQRKQFEANEYFLNNDPILIYIAQKDPDFFCKLKQKYNFQSTLGRRTSKKLITQKKDLVLSNPKSYSEILHGHSLVRKLGGDFKQFFHEIFPKSTQTTELSDFYYLKYTKYFPKKYRFLLYKTTFDSIFYPKFGENLDLITFDKLELIYDVNEREKYAQAMLKKSENEKLYRYFSPKTCLDTLIPKFKLASRVRRLRYMKVMTECALLNRDQIALKRLSVLLITRCKNEDLDMHSEFLNEIFNRRRFVDTFTEDLWKVLAEVIINFRVRNDYIGYSDYRYFIKYLEFRFNNNQPLTEELKKYKYDEHGALLFFDFEKNFQNPKFRKAFLIELLNIPSPPRNDDNKFNVLSFKGSIIEQIIIHNKHAKNDRIDLFQYPDLLQIVHELLLYPGDKTSIRPRPEVEFVIFNYPDLKAREQLQDIYFDKLVQYVNNNHMVLKFLKTHPEVFVKYVKYLFKEWDLVEHLSKPDTFKIMRNYSHLELDKKLIEDFLEKFKDKDCDHKEKLVLGLSILMSPKEYLEFAKKMKKGKDSKTLNAIADQLQNLPGSDKIFNQALTFCKEGKSKGVRPLYSFLYNTPENQLQKYLSQLNNSKGISVKKHATILTCALCDRVTILNCLKHNSIPVARYIFKYFVKNPDDDFWNLLLLHISKVKGKDTEILELITQTPIPVKYRNKCNEFLWNILNQSSNTQLKKTLLPKLFGVDQEFCSKILESSFLTIENVDEFAVNYLLHGRSEQRISTVLSQLVQLKEKCCTLEEELAYKAKIKNFISKLFKTYMESKEVDDTFAKSILIQFAALFPVYQYLNEFVILSLLSCKEKEIEIIGEIVSNLNTKLVDECSDIILNLLANIIKDHQQYFLKTEESKHFLPLYLFKKKKSIEDVILAIKLLPESPAENVKTQQEYQEMIKSLQVETDNRVKLILFLYFANLTPTNQKISDGASEISEAMSEATI